jgi:hypothetical protein
LKNKVNNENREDENEEGGIKRKMRKSRREMTIKMRRRR